MINSNTGTSAPSLPWAANTISNNDCLSVTKRKTRGILNKLTVDLLDEHCVELISSGVESIPDYLIDSLLEKDAKFSTLHAQLCSKIVAIGKDGFKAKFLNILQSRFDNIILTRHCHFTRYGINVSLTPDELDEVYSLSAKLRNAMALVCELYKVGIFPIQSLLEKINELGQIKDKNNNELSLDLEFIFMFVTTIVSKDDPNLSMLMSKFCKETIQKLENLNRIGFEREVTKLETFIK